MGLAELLSGGDPRSLGRTEEIVEQVLNNESQLPQLIDCLFSDDEIVRMRASDALEKICRQKPEWFKPYVERLLLDEMPAIRQPSVQWHLAQMLAEIALNKQQKSRAIEIMEHNLDTMDDWIVVNLTLEALAKFARDGELPRDTFINILKQQQGNRHKSVTSRAHKLLKEFDGYAC